MKIKTVAQAILITFLICGFNRNIYADLKYSPLNLNLSSDRNTYAPNESIQFNLTFTNNDIRDHSILLPNNMIKGNKIIYLSYYTVKDNFYTEVFRESRIINIDSSYQGYILYKNLNANSSVTVPLFINDSTNYSRHIEAHHLLPNLAAGNYQVLAWYDPWQEPMAEHCFNKISDFDKGKNIINDTNKINLPAEGLISNYFELIITDETTNIKNWDESIFCAAKCSLCRMIEKENWKRVEEIISDQTYYNGLHDMQFTDSGWLQPHRNIAFIYDGPDNILSSLPSYTSRRMIFKNKNGHHYFNAVWQIGIVYPMRSRISSWIFRRKSPIKTSEVDYLKLIQFQEE